jgi:predicted flap endonuclease-1-like 5' DNA nuclease
MNTDENRTASADAAGNDLEEIDGLGESSAEALNRSGIYRLADLLHYNTPDELQQALEKAGEKIPLWRIEKGNWLGQAREKVLAQQANPEPPAPRETAEVEREPEQLSPAEEWEQYVGFNLYFETRMDKQGQKEWRTVIYKSLEPDNFNDKEEFSGIEPAPWVNWILEQATLPVAAEPSPTETEVAAESAPAETEAAVPPERLAPEEAGIEILGVQLSKLGALPGVPKKRLIAKVRFQLSGAEAGRLTTDRLPFRIEVHTVDLESGDADLVASRPGQLQPQVFEYSSQQQFPIPQLGRYELHTVVLLLPPHENMASYRGPTLTVVP